MRTPTDPAYQPLPGESTSPTPTAHSADVHDGSGHAAVNRPRGCPTSRRPQSGREIFRIDDDADEWMDLTLTPSQTSLQPEPHRRYLNSGNSEQDVESYERAKMAEDEVVGRRRSNAHDDDDDSSDSSDEEDSPFEMVRAVVSNKDDPSLPSLTLRVWTLGLFFLVILSVVNQFFWFRESPIGLGGVIILLLSYPMGRFLAWYLPHREVYIWGIGRVPLNPGPFSIKEHVLVSIIANSGAGTAYAIDVVVIKRLFYKMDLPFTTSLLLLLTSQLVGYGLAGIARRYLIQPAAMIWPGTLVSVALFRTFHEQEASARGGLESAQKLSMSSDDIEMSALDDTLTLRDGSVGLREPSWESNRSLMGSICRVFLSALRQVNRLTRIQFFWVFFCFSFSWYFLPGYLFTALSSISLLCLMAPHSLLANQWGDGRNGLGFLAFSLDWSMVSSSYLSSPVATPFWVACNLFGSFVVVMWIMVPLAYYSNIWDTAQFPIYTPATFDVSGHPYNITRVMPNGQYNEGAYQTYSPLRLTFEFAITYGFSFASFASILTYIVLYYYQEIWQRFTESRTMVDDIHAKLMQHYPEVPSGWYTATFLINGLLAIILCEWLGINLPWWALLLALGISSLFIIPVGIIAAVSNQAPALNVITEFIIGYILPGRPIANITFKTYGTITLTQGMALIGDMKLGHYMKIPPRHMFICQFTGTLLAGIIQLATAYYLMDNIPHMCERDNLPWTCRGAHTFYSASIIWGLIGPQKMFGPDSPYHFTLWFFLLGFLLPLPVYFLQRKFPRVSWLQHVHVPIIFSALDAFPPGPALVYPVWFAACYLFNRWIYRRFRAWWERFAFIFSVAMDSGLAVAGLFIFFFFQSTGLNVNWWGNDTSQCPLSEQSLIPPKTI
ncbi:hypothetical protein IWQ61_001254 [Dispira simplex]|nr:hypothetical protein IWQ61_001254 [Dispira simplex]